MRANRLSPGQFSGARGANVAVYGSGRGYPLDETGRKAHLATDPALKTVMALRGMTESWGVARNVPAAPVADLRRLGLAPTAALTRAAPVQAAYQVIRGKFFVKGYSPDGDSVRFKADNPKDWRKVPGNVKRNELGYSQLRIEAVDTLETHFLGGHQPAFLANKATDKLLEVLGIKNVKWDSARKVVTDADDGVEGFIITAGTDKYGRPISFVFAGSPPEDGAALEALTVEMLRKSVNYQLLTEGMAYPMFYEQLPEPLRNAMIAAVGEARQRHSGIWAVDRTTAGFAVTGLGSIMDEHVIYPKLFRRLYDLIQKGGTVDGFLEFLRKKPEMVMVLSAAVLGGAADPTNLLLRPESLLGPGGPNVPFVALDTLVRVEGNRVRLTENPEDLVFADS